MMHSFINKEIESLKGTNLDSSQYLGLLFKKELEKNKKGINIGQIKVLEKDFTISIVGVPAINNHKGEVVNSPIEYRDYIKEGREKELNHETISYIEIGGEMEGKKFMGIFFSLDDAFDHMGKIEKGELVAEQEFVSI